MNIGDTVIYGGRRLVVRGIDPAGVDPRFVYLEDARTGKTVSVRLEEPPGAARNHVALHLVDHD